LSVPSRPLRARASREQRREGGRHRQGVRDSEPRVGGPGPGPGSHASAPVGGGDDGPSRRRPGPTTASRGARGGCPSLRRPTGAVAGHRAAPAVRRARGGRGGGEERGGWAACPSEPCCPQRLRSCSAVPAPCWCRGRLAAAEVPSVLLQAIGVDTSPVARTSPAARSVAVLLQAIGVDRRSRRIPRSRSALPIWPGACCRCFPGSPQPSHPEPYFGGAGHELSRFVQSFEALLIFISSLCATPKASAAGAGADTHTQASFNTIRYKGRDSAAGIGRKLSITRPGAMGLTASQAGENSQTHGPEHTIVSSILTDLIFKRSQGRRVVSSDPPLNQRSCRVRASFEILD
jgi:hypothetical protein